MASVQQRHRELGGGGGAVGASSEASPPPAAAAVSRRQPAVGVAPAPAPAARRQPAPVDGSHPEPLARTRPAAVAPSSGNGHFDDGSTDAHASHAAAPLRTATASRQAPSAGARSGSATGGSAASFSADGSYPLNGSGGGGATGSVISFYIDSLDPASVESDECVDALSQLSASSAWRPGVLGSLHKEAGETKPLPVSSLRDVIRVVDEVATICANSNHDWKARDEVLKRLRGVIAGGATAEEGFASQILRLRDPLVAQLQDLRSQVVRSACMAVSELSAATSESGLFEHLADPIIETLLRQSMVTIQIIAQSAHGAAETIVHNARHGFPRVLARLIGHVRRHKHAVMRAKAADCLLQALRTWPAACLDRFVDDLQAAVVSMLSDADASVRQNGRFAFWSFASLYPDRADAIADRVLDEGRRRQLEEERDPAFHRLVEKLCEPMAVLVVQGGSGGDGGASSDSGYGGAATGGFASSRVGAARRQVSDSNGNLPASATAPAPAPSRPAPSQPSAASATALARAETQRAPSAAAQKPAPAPASVRPRAGSVGSTASDGSGSVSAPAAAAARPGQQPAPQRLQQPQQLPPIAGRPPMHGTSQRSALPPVHSQQQQAPLAVSAPPPSSAVASGASPELAIPACVKRALSAGADVATLRARLHELMLALVNSHAVSSASVERGYGGRDRLPPSLAGGRLPPFDSGFEFVPEDEADVSQPVLMDNLSAPAVDALAHEARGGGPLLNLLAAALSAPSPAARLDGAALLFALLDTGADVESEAVASASAALPRDLVDALRHEAQDSLQDADAAAAEGIAHPSSPSGPLVSADGSLAVLRPTRMLVPVVNDAGEDDNADLTVVPVYAQVLTAPAPGMETSGGLSPHFQRIFGLVLGLSVAPSDECREAGSRLLQVFQRTLRPAPFSAASVAVVCSSDWPHPVRRQALALLSSIAHGPDPGSLPEDEVGASAHAGAVEDSFRVLDGFADSDGAGALAQVMHACAELAGPGEGDAAFETAGALDDLCQLLDQTHPGSLADAVASLPFHSVQVLIAVTDNEGPLFACLEQREQDEDAVRQQQEEEEAALVEQQRQREAAAAEFRAPPASASQQPTYDRRSSLVTASSPFSAPAPAGPPSLPMAGRAHTFARTGSLGSYSTAPAPSSAPAPVLQRPDASMTYATPVSAQAPASRMSQGPAAAAASYQQPQLAVSFTRDQLSAMLDGFASPDKARRMGALQSLGIAAEKGTVHGPDGRPALPPRPVTLGEVQMPSHHARDAAWVATWDRVLDGVAAFVPLQLDPATGQIDGVMTQTALSVLRKLYRNFVPYVSHRAPHVFGSVFRAMGPRVPKDIQSVLEKTIEEVGARLLLGDQLKLLSQALCEAPLEHVTALSVACRQLVRLMREADPDALLDELDAGDLLHGIGRAVTSSNPLARLAGLQLLLSLALELGDNVMRPYASQVLTPPQLHHLSSHVAKVRASGGATTGVAGGDGMMLSPLAAQMQL